LALKIADSRPDPEEAYAQAERFHILERTLLQLPAPYRSTLLLRDFEGLSTDEAARVLRTSQGTFKSRLHRARRMVVRDGSQRRGSAAHVAGIIRAKLHHA
jgi:RNA polymerase sigma-70 factor, ECF subfamily